LPGPLRDNFLRSWLAALHSPVSAINFRPEAGLVEQADERLAQVEGHGLERLAAQLYEERSRRGVGDFALTARIDGYWDRKDTEVDLVAINEDDRVVRFGTIKRNAARLPEAADALAGHTERFLAAHQRFDGWRVERVAIAPAIEPAVRGVLQARGVMAQDLTDLIQGL
jgi:hypothetical protein